MGLALGLFLLWTAGLAIAVVADIGITDPLAKQPSMTRGGPSKKVIGAKDPYLAPAAPGVPAVTVTTFDTTTYFDRAILKLTNSTGGGAQLYDMSIRGKPVIELSGMNGLKFEVSDYAAIDRDGEKEFGLANDFIFDHDQVEQIGDWLQKELRPHDMYSLKLHGRHPYFEVGDRYTMTLTHEIGASTSEMENHDIDVMVQAVGYEQSYDRRGETSLVVRVPSDAWSKTTTTRARILAAGLPFDSIQRGNIVTVASSTYAGAADYYCDGTADEAEIQAALDDIADVGYGDIYLTGGPFYISSVITMPSNVNLIGSGSSTIFYFTFTTGKMIDMSGISNALLSSICIDGEDTSRSLTQGVIYGSSVGENVYLEKIEVKNLYRTGGAAQDILAINVDEANLSHCFVHDINNANIAIAGGIKNAQRVMYCQADDITAASGFAYGFQSCKRCVYNKSTNAGTFNYFACYADSGTSYAVADTPDGGWNS